MSEDARRYAPATLRNRQPILDVLKPHLPARGLLLEIASGSGEHAVFFGQQLGAAFELQPSDPDATARASIDAWVREQGLTNVRPALPLDAAAATWPIERADAVACINMIHISPWAATVGLMRGAARLLPAGGPLYLYGPYLRRGVETAASNAAFDADLKARNPAWGLRDLDAVAALAAEHGFSGPEVVEMPANNLSVVLRRG